MNETNRYIGMLLDDRYELVEQVGEGGMALVFRALDRRLNRNVAVKIMRDEMAADEEFKRRFCAESQAVAMLSHPNIVAVYDVSHNDKIEYIVMELIDGITLKQYMDRRGILSWKEAVHFSKQIARALGHAHERGIIHRDIKPQNIMLLRDGTIKVADFGIASLESELHESDGQAIGSIHYIAPEQARGELPDARSDIYSLGVVMYEMMTGKVPYTGDSLGEIAVKHMNAAPTPIHEINKDLPGALEEIIMRAMAANLQDRYQTAAELADDLEALSRESEEDIEAADREETLSVPDVKPVRSVSELSKKSFARRRRRADRVIYLFGSFLVLVLAIALFQFLWKYWVEDIFSPANRIALPEFVGMDYETLINDPDMLDRYNFEVTYVVDAGSPPNRVLKQDPKPGRSVMVVPSGIQVRLEVSTYSSQVAVPDLVDRYYVDALLLLQNAGFNCEIENATSDTVGRDYVIASSPSAGEELSFGSTVYLTVSSGPEILTVDVPNLVGISEDAAKAKLESVRLSFGSVERVTSDFEAGTVIGQVPEAFTQIEEHAKITLIISAGPGEQDD
ncbi:MAG: Stk1 family PASTA domain-containing Ser/Thr kinase [Oscillospiraceae bacterium]|nr:Stk1 family PASTA domain-containing Ser/Thr kinase [Oscillospiraceae bacterium]